MKVRVIILLSAICLLRSAASFASTGTEGAAFLNIPVGAGPAAVGSAYTALADDAYAPTWNPGGLGFLNSNQFSGQHLSYLDSLHYEYLSFAVPLRKSIKCTDMDSCPGNALGGSVQYLGTGDINSTDGSGNSLGSFSSYYASYNLAFGHSFSEKLSLGLTGKLISAKLADTSATAYAADLGGMYRPDKKLTLAATVTNLGSKLTFVDQGDPLPLAFHLGASFKPTSTVLLTTEGIYAKTGDGSFRVGGEWRPISMLSLRTGYRTDNTKNLSVLAGFSTGVGIEVWGSELAYAWLPYGDLGNTHYFSLVMKFGEQERAKRNLIQYQHIKTHRTADSDGSAPDYQQILELLNDTEQHLAQGTPTREKQ